MVAQVVVVVHKGVVMSYQGVVVVHKGVVMSHQGVEGFIRE